MDDQRILQYTMNWLMVNNYLIHEAETPIPARKWGTPEDTHRSNKDKSKYIIGMRDPFYVTNSELSTEMLANLQALIGAEMIKRKGAAERT